MYQTQETGEFLQDIRKNMHIALLIYIGYRYHSSAELRVDLIINIGDPKLASNRIQVNLFAEDFLNKF